MFLDIFRYHTPLGTKMHSVGTKTRLYGILKNGMKKIGNIQKHVVENIQKNTLERKLR